MQEISRKFPPYKEQSQALWPAGDTPACLAINSRLKTDDGVSWECAPRSTAGWPNYWMETG